MAVPEYGNEHENLRQENQFFAPGDTEEALLDDLHELNPNDISFEVERVLGEGIFILGSFMGPPMGGYGSRIPREN